MMTLEESKWFEREFLPIGDDRLIPNILMRLEGTPLRVAAKVRGTKPDLLTAKPGGRWSVKEEIGHLIDLESLWLGRISDMANGASELRSADLSNLKTHDADHNKRSLTDLVRTLHRERSMLIETVENLDNSILDKSPKHPRLGTPMPLVDLLYFIAEHDDHHLVKIDRLISKKL